VELLAQAEGKACVSTAVSRKKDLWFQVELRDYVVRERWK
jgi:hypothetical protein